MKALSVGLGILALATGTCRAEDLTLPKDAVMRADRSLVSLKAGTVVEIIERGEKTITIRYKGQVGTISAARVAPAKPVAAGAATPTPKSIVADHPQSFYGNVVKKAETNAAKHDDTLVKPADDVMADPPSK